VADPAADVVADLGTGLGTASGGIPGACAETRPAAGARDAAAGIIAANPAGRQRRAWVWSPRCVAS